MTVPRGAEIVRTVDGRRRKRVKNLCMLRPRLFLFAIALLCLSAILRAGEPPHVKVSLIPEVRTVAPGTPFSVAVHLKMDPRWHTYWINPGDSGAPTEIKWRSEEHTSELQSQSNLVC